MILCEFWCDICHHKWEEYCNNTGPFPDRCPVCNVLRSRGKCECVEPKTCSKCGPQNKQNN